MAIDFNTDPYFDDYDVSKNFAKILFRPGIAVQTRELNQLQSILQEQIANGADIVFTPNSRVSGGQNSYSANQRYIKLNATGLSSSYDVIGKRIRNTTNTLSAIIKHVEKKTTTDPDTLYLEYTGLSSDTAALQFGNNQNLIIEDTIPFQVTTATTAAAGVGSLASIKDGVFYINRQFVFIPSQSAVVSKYSSVTSETSVGVVVAEEIITPDEDDSLYDNANGFPNFSAPGAHRYRLSGSLIAKPNVLREDLYFELFKVNESKIVATVPDTQYASLIDTLAKRTYDESGDYIVDDFILDVKEHLNQNNNYGVFPAGTGDATKLVYILDQGLAYIRGYAVQTLANTLLSVPKARTTKTVTEILVPMLYDSSFVINTISTNLPTLNQVIQLKQAGADIGTAIARTISYVSPGVFRLEFFGAKFNAGKGITNVTSVAQVAVGFTATVQSYSFNGADTSFVFPINLGLVKQLNDASYQYWNTFTANFSGTTLSISSASQFSANRFDYVVQYVSGGVQYFNVPTAVSLSPDNKNATLTMGNAPVPTNASSATIVANLTQTSGVSASKSIQTTTQNLTSAATITLNQADIFDIVSITDANGTDVKARFSLDNGQRETFYDFGSLSLIPGQQLPSGTLAIQYRYFVHGTGDFFSANSYAGTSYDLIPKFTNSKGQSIFLASAIDFRQKVSGTGVIAQGTSARIFEANQAIDSDFEYYLGRIDKIIATKDGKIQVTMGEPSDQPVEPQDPSNGITLYTISVPPYTFKRSDVQVKKLSYRRYTMKDIDNIAGRVANLEKVSALTLAEASIANKNIASAFKSGFIVDSFEDNFVSDNDSGFNKCSFDLNRGQCRPEFDAKSINLEVSQLNSTVIKNGIAYLTYTEVPMITQNLASEVQRIQPYILYRFDGVLKLSPESDSWTTTLQLPDNVLDNGKIRIVTEYRDVTPRGALVNSTTKVTWEQNNAVIVMPVQPTPVVPPVAAPIVRTPVWTTISSERGFLPTSNQNGLIRQLQNAGTQFRIVSTGPILNRRQLIQVLQ